MPVGNAAENIRKLCLGYVQFAAINRGIGPADQEALAKFIAERSEIPPAEAEAMFTSIRDNQPYIIRWALPPMRPGATDADSPTPEVIIYESEGADGTRYVADGRMSIRELSADEFSQVVPNP